jgi:hypothetical protein
VWASATAERDWLLKLLEGVDTGEGACKSGYKLSNQPQNAFWFVDRVTWRGVGVCRVARIVPLWLFVKENVVL